LALILVVLFYAFSIGAGQKFYLLIYQFFWGFNKLSYDFLAAFFLFFLVLAPSAVLPLSLNRPSSIFFIPYFFVYVPSVVIELLNYSDIANKIFLGVDRILLWVGVVLRYGSWR
jgi:hypothetical protein